MYYVFANCIHTFNDVSEKSLCHERVTRKNMHFDTAVKFLKREREEERKEERKREAMQKVNGFSIVCVPFILLHYFHLYAPGCATICFIIFYLCFIVRNHLIIIHPYYSRNI